VIRMNKKVIIEGEKVHHVGYRPFLIAKARRLGIPNYESDNVEVDGKQRVIVSVGGDEKQVQEFVEFAKETYPKNAKVSRVWEAEPPESVMLIDEYQKVLDTEQHDTMVQAGLGMLGKQDQMIEMQKITVGNQEKMLGKQDQMLEKQDKTIEVFGGKIDNLTEETKQDFTNLRQDYGKIYQIMEKINENLEKLTKAILALAEKKS